MNYEAAFFPILSFSAIAVKTAQRKATKEKLFENSIYRLGGVNRTTAFPASAGELKYPESPMGVPARGSPRGGPGTRDGRSPNGREASGRKVKMVGGT